MTVAALFTAPDGPYPALLGVEQCWDEKRDARLYKGPHPVVAHPPCNLWVNLAAVNWKRYGRQKPAWYDGGSDGGCFEAAFKAVHRWGGVLEHPAHSWAWQYHVLRKPVFGRWARDFNATRGDWSGWVTCVHQSDYGHPARKATWLYWAGPGEPPPMRWGGGPAPTHQVGWFDRAKPTVGKKTAIHTPPAFATALIALARAARKNP